MRFLKYALHLLLLSSRNGGFGLKQPDVSTSEVLFPDAQTAAESLVGSAYHADFVPPKLPKGCNDFEVIKWPSSGKRPSIVLIGEAHEDKCQKARRRCTTALLLQKGMLNKTHEDVTLLFEGWAQGQALDCQYITHQDGTYVDYSEITDTCKGWSTPEKDRKEIEENLMHLQELKKHYSAISAFANKPYAGLKKYLEDKIARCESQLLPVPQLLAKKDAKSKRKYETQNLLKKIEALQFEQALLKKILGKFEAAKGLKAMPAVRKDMLRDIERMEEKVQKFSHDMDIMIKKPNDFLLKSIKSASKENIVFAYAGAAHLYLYPQTNLDKQSYAKYEKVIGTLHAGLNADADENPYAILSCT